MAASVFDERDDSWQDPDALEALAPRATSVTLAGSQRRVHTATLLR
jgi:hypothetical protein